MRRIANAEKGNIVLTQNLLNLVGGVAGGVAVFVAGPEIAALLGVASVVCGVASCIPALGDSQPHD